MNHPIPVIDLEMTVRLCRVLRDNNIRDLRELTKLTEVDFINIKGVGLRVFKEATEILEENGLSFESEENSYIRFKKFIKKAIHDGMKAHIKKIEKERKMNHQKLKALCTRRDALKQLIPVWLGDTTVLEIALKNTEKEIEAL